MGRAASDNVSQPFPISHTIHTLARSISAATRGTAPICGHDTRGSSTQLCPKRVRPARHTDTAGPPRVTLTLTHRVKKGGEQSGF